ncbi:hypothetical protein GDO81_016522 [Engystomops pustulosus]|uniref:Uncharacterized protein n=1 Tax=Engystomops pustulosus TaxID=76066 RepID=A0AAV7ATV7_ENGPU|nr:hypothetical protein GDO81_016522 [Engystomops pustulosus]
MKVKDVAPNASKIALHECCHSRRDGGGHHFTFLCGFSCSSLPLLVFFYTVPCSFFDDCHLLSLHVTDNVFVLHVQKVMSPSLSMSWPGLGK